VTAVAIYQASYKAHSWLSREWVVSVTQYVSSMLTKPVLGFLVCEWLACSSHDFKLADNAYSWFFSQ
jgi:hypothetical protein